MKTKTIIVLIIMFIAHANYSSAKNTDNAIISPDKGKAIFTTRCNSCHNVNAQIVGPALAKVDERHSIDWIVSFVHSPKTLIQKNDKDAVALYNQFNQIVMPDHQDLSSDDIKSVVAYVKSETKNIATTEAPFVKPGKRVPNYHPLSITKNAGFFISYLTSVFVLVLLMIFAVHIKDMQRQQQSVYQANDNQMM